MEDKFKIYDETEEENETEIVEETDEVLKVRIHI